MNGELKSRLFRGGSRNANVVCFTIKNRQRNCGEEKKTNKTNASKITALLRLYLSELPHLMLSLSLSYFINCRLPTDKYKIILVYKHGDSVNRLSLPHCGRSQFASICAFILLIILWIYKYICQTGGVFYTFSH